MSSLIVKVCSVYSIEKHPNADRLSIVTIDNENGWKCIVGLDQYKRNDRVVYIPPDCIIPPSLIEKYNLEYLKHNGKTSSIKLRGYISQGLILEVPPGNWKLGDDVAQVMGIIKYEPPEKFTINPAKVSTKKKLNPNFDKYTDIENIKNFGGVFKDGDLVCVTEKIHGCNARYGNLPIEYPEKGALVDKLKYIWKKYILKQTHEFVYGSHNIQISSSNVKKSFYGTDVWGRIAKKYNLANILPENYIFYGEIYGNGIQDLTYGKKNEGDIDIRWFDIKNVLNGKYASLEEFAAWMMSISICTPHEFDSVPVLFIGKYNSTKLGEWTNGESKLCPGQLREGCVIKPVFEENDPFVGRKILKSVSEEYLTRKSGTEFK
jgi:RNA ligase (TIGR02306 family)